MARHFLPADKATLEKMQQIRRNFRIISETAEGVVFETNDMIPTNESDQNLVNESLREMNS